jgi:RNA polymerase sigma factor (sigma-70 family)
LGGLLRSFVADRLLLIARSFGCSGEDAVQEAFMALSRQPKLPDEPLAWLVKVARNQVLQWNRSEQRRTQRHLVRAADSSWFENAEHESIDAIEVTEALKKLPNNLCEVVTMHLWGQLTFEQIADVVGSSRSTVYRRYADAIQILRERFSCYIEK